MEVHPLPPLTHPDLNDWVVHFAGRDGQSTAAPEIQALSPRQRFVQIISESRLLGFEMFGAGGARAVCFTESTKEGCQWLVREGRYPPYGIVFSKQTVFARGGGPALYVRGDDWPHTWQWAPEMRARAVRLWPGATPDEGEPPLGGHLASQSWWLMEREWRALPNTPDHCWTFTWSDIAFLIVPDHGVIDDIAHEFLNDPHYRQYLDALPVMIMNDLGQIVTGDGTLVDPPPPRGS